MRGWATVDAMVKQSLIYLISGVVSKAAPFLLLPVLTSQLSQADFGRLSLFLSINLFSSAIVGFSLQASITKNYAALDKSDLAVLIGNLLFVLSCSVGFWLFCTTLLAEVGSKIFPIRSDFFFFFPVIAGLSMIGQIFLTLLRNQDKAHLFFLSELVYAVLVFGGTVLLINFTNLGWISQVVAMFTAAGTIALFGVSYLKKSGYLKFAVSIKSISPVLKLSAPLIPHVVAGAVIMLTDRIIIERLLGLEAVSVYTVGYSFGMVVLLFSDAFTKAWTPLFFKRLSADSAENRVVLAQQVFLFIFGLFMIAQVLSFFFVNIIPIILPATYLGAASLVLVISNVYVVYGAYKIFYPFFIITNKTGHLAAVTGISALLNVAFNFYLIPIFGVGGAALASGFSYVFSLVCVVAFQMYYFPMPWRRGVTQILGKCLRWWERGRY